MIGEVAYFFCFFLKRRGCFDAIYDAVVGGIFDSPALM